MIPIRIRLVAVTAFCLIFPTAVGAGPSSRLEYAQKCAAEMGPVPAFNCLDGQLIPITKHGIAQSSPSNECDKPVQLGLSTSGQCIPFARLLRLPTSDPDVETVAICRKYHGSSGPDDPIFHDIAVIQHNRATGNTCFFQAPVPLETPVDGRVVPSPQADTGEARSYWLEPTGGGPGGIDCTQCHDADPFIWSPYVAQVADLSKWDPLGKWSANFQGLFPSAPRTFSPSGNACAACHRIGSNTCETFVKYYTIGPKRQATHPDEFWMPPGFSSTPEAWHSQFDGAMNQITRCCTSGGQPAECNTLVAEEQDADRDGHPDSRDNCPRQSNPDQRDADADGLGDRCDSDRDGDGVPNHSDNCPGISNADQADNDHDGIGDACQMTECHQTCRRQRDQCMRQVGTEGGPTAAECMIEFVQCMTDCTVPE
jgi:hypothetical protein